MALLVSRRAMSLARRVEVRAGRHAAVRCVAQLVDVESVLARGLRGVAVAHIMVTLAQDGGARRSERARTQEL
eukprot:COSAG02_NODE_6256_length_3698_cov_6.245902_1_plen_73_part_00